MKGDGSRFLMHCRTRMYAQMAISAAFLFHTAPIDAALICREPIAQSYEAEYARAVAALPTGYTSDPSKAVIYGERAHDGSFYFQSNFINPGFHNPTKLASVKPDEVTDTLAVWENTVFLPDHNFSSAEKSAASFQYRHSKFIFASNLLDENGRLPFDVAGVNNIEIVDHGHHQVLPAIPIDTPISPPPSWIARIHGCCLYVRPPASSAGLMSRLAAVRFKKSDMHFVSLVVDSPTERAIRNSSLSGVAVHVDLHKDLGGQLDQIMGASSGATVVVLGHFEDGSFVVTDSKSAEIGRVDLSELSEMARRHGVSLVAAGCNTAREMKHRSGSLVAIPARFRATDAVRLLSAAVDKANSYAELLDELSAPEFPIVVDENALRTSGQVKMAFHNPVTGKVALAVGVVVVSFGAGDMIAATRGADPEEEQEVQYNRGKQVHEAIERLLNQ